MIGSFICISIGRNDSLHSPCMVKKHDLKKKSFSGKQWDSQWNTGATCSVITPGIIKYLNIAPVSYVIVSGVNGIERAAQYYVDFGLPGGVIVEKILAVEGTPLGCDLLYSRAEILAALRRSFCRQAAQQSLERQQAFLRLCHAV